MEKKLTWKLIGGGIGGTLTVFIMVFAFSITYFPPKKEIESAQVRNSIDSNRYELLESSILNILGRLDNLEETININQSDTNVQFKILNRLVLKNGKEK